MVVQHCHTFDHWTMIWIFFIKKDMGNLHINKLCTLYLLEADYNCFPKWFSPKGFIKHAKDNQQLTDYQGGGW